MPTIGWIDALKRYNMGGTSWCIPRKGTSGYDQVMRIRKGEQMKTPKELIADLEVKTGGKPKKEKVTMKIDLTEPKPAPEPKPKKKRVVKAMVPKSPKKKEEKMETYDHDDKEYKEKLAAFKKMVGYKD